MKHDDINNVKNMFADNATSAAIYELNDLQEIIDQYSQGVDDLNAWAKDEEHGLTPEARRKINQAAFSCITGGSFYLLNHFPFAGAFGSNLRRLPSYDLQAPMAVNATTMGLSTTLNLFYNPLWMIYIEGKKSKGTFLVCNDQNQRFYNLAAVLYHEYSHLLWNHPSQYKFYQEKGYGLQVNLATDCQINQDEFVANNKTLTDYGITLDAMKKYTKDPSLKEKETSYYYLQALMKTNPKPQQQPQSGTQSGQGQQSQSGSSQQQQNQTNNQQQQQVSVSQGQKQGQGNGTNPLNPAASHAVWQKTPDDVADGQLADESIAEESAAQQQTVRAIKNAMKASNTSAKEMKSRGLAAGSLIDAAVSGSVTSGKLPIKSVIQKGAGRLQYGEHRTYSRINHQQGARINILRGKKADNHKNIRVFIDNSGSMGLDEIEFAVKEIAAVAFKIKANLDLIPFDAQVYPENIQKVDRHGHFEFEPVGRGGTAYQPIFDYLKDDGANNKNDLIIILSDGYGESNVDTYKLRNIIWILVEEKRNTLSVDNPVGQVAWLDNDNKYKLHKMQQG